MSKLDETLKEREEVRANILALRKALADKKALAVTLRNEVEDISRGILKYEKLLVDLSGKAAALLHADCAGICGKQQPEVNEVILTGGPS